MNGMIIALLSNAGAFLTTLSVFVYKQGKTDGKLEQIDKRVERIEDNQNGLPNQAGR